MSYYNIIYILILWIMNIYNYSYSLSLPRFQRLS
nr:MAG TPA: hypothetical protein [Caudoviricetes sp.]